MSAKSVKTVKNDKKEMKRRWREQFFGSVISSCCSGRIVGTPEDEEEPPFTFLRP